MGWGSNEAAGVIIIDSYLRMAHGVGYKDRVRAEMRLRLLQAIVIYVISTKSIIKVWIVKPGLRLSY